MSLRANPTYVGVFVTGALALAVAAVLVFGSGSMFRHQQTFVVYFAESVNGLSKGSAVKFKGVQIGEVTDIRLHYNQPSEPPYSDYVPVFITIDTSLMRNRLGVAVDLTDPVKVQELVNEGLRAKLQLQSLLTGMLYIELDVVLGPDGRPPAAVLIELTPEYPEIPSVSSGLSEVLKSVTIALQNISQIDFKGIAAKVDTLLDQLNTGIAQVNFQEINNELVATLRSLNAVLSDPKLREAIGHLDSALVSVQGLADNVNAQVQPLSGEIQLTAQRARVTLGEIDSTLQALRAMVEPQSSLRYEIDNALGEIADAARSLRILLDYLERNPNAILTGKPPPPPVPTAQDPAPAPSRRGGAGSP